MAAENRNCLALVCYAGEQRVAFRLPQIVRVVAAAALQQSPDAPEHLLGLLNLGGEIIPVFDLLFMLGAGRHRLRASDSFVLVQAEGRRFGFRVTGIDAIVAIPEASVRLLSDFQIEGELHGAVVAAEDGTLLLMTPERLTLPDALRMMPIAAGSGI
ncbi:MAG: chemotaxis protein CheW [Leptospirales bacterium]|nr:chemotaxis protein CheW [Leptospirales bacterium]